MPTDTLIKPKITMDTLETELNEIIIAVEQAICINEVIESGYFRDSNRNEGLLVHGFKRNQSLLGIEFEFMLKAKKMLDDLYNRIELKSKLQ